MTRVDPTAELVGFCRDWWHAGGRRAPRIPKPERRALMRLGMSPDAVDVLDACLQLSDFLDSREYAGKRQAVRDILAERVSALPRVRTPAHHAAFVESMGNMLQHLGIPHATAERSRYVQALRELAHAARLEFDPHVVVRRKHKRQVEARRQAELAARELVRRALLRGLGGG